MYTLYVGFFLLVGFIAFMWLCSASIFNWIGLIAYKFVGPFKNKNENKGDKNE